ncbi:MAG: hypothetical protein J5J00_11345 [Deltaproteobacteria bacterium]|nr:hypothetical protein [Deltaproteobacteria bacterium]
MSKALSMLIVISLAVLLFSGTCKDRLPEPEKLLPAIAAEPVQDNKEQLPFDFKYMGTRYVVYPQASYELSGLLVSHNDITAWWDIYHDENSVDIKDICVVWGENLQPGVYKEVEFYNESVSCHYRPLTQKSQLAFNPRQFSNNHLLSGDETVRDTIRNLKIGDQIKIRGRLVNYHQAGYSELVRRTSLTRSDTAGGACEVIYVDELEVVSRAPRGWSRAYDISRRALFYGLLLKLLLFLLLPWLEYRYN